MVTSGTLEMVDREFSNIVESAQRYAQVMKSSDPSIDNDELSGLALIEILIEFLQQHNLAERKEIRNTDVDVSDLLTELAAFNITTIRQLREFIAQQKVSDALTKYAVLKNEPLYLPGFYRIAMISNDPHLFFKTVSEHVNSQRYIYGSSFLEIVGAAIGRKDLAKICSDAGVSIR